MERKSVSIIGATGSIGDSTLDLIRRHSDKYDVKVLTAGANGDKLIKLIHEFTPEYVAINDESQIPKIKSVFSNVKILNISEAASVDADWTIAAIVGVAGLIPTMNAIKRGQTVAFASKECLVAAGNVMMQAVEKYGTQFLPVDSEHNAIFQVFDKKQKNAIRRLILTASGGPFRSWDWDDMVNATPQQAVAHPTWSMGAKISIDSASLMNKALEIIEAHYLFDMPADKIDVVIHPQSIIHSMVEYNDGSILSQMGPSDMKTPIAYCLGWPDRIEATGNYLDFASLNNLTFEQPNTNKFKSLKIVYDVLNEGQSSSIIFNAANEIANAAFLNGQIGFTKIYDVIEMALDKTPRITITNIDDVIALDADTRKIAETFVK
jgi:1-deoxy-D-xylulose-5-phosphate reductoisomerase